MRILTATMNCPAFILVTLYNIWKYAEPNAPDQAIVVLLYDYTQNM